VRVLITGGAGFIGSRLALALLRRGHDITCVDDLSGAIDWRNLSEEYEYADAATTPDGTTLRMIATDCASMPHMREVVEAYGPFDVVAHAAANAREGASQFQPHSICYRNLLAASAVLATTLNAGTRRFVVFSSMSVYGAQLPPFDESMGHVPEDVYGVNKAAVEDVTRILCEVHGAEYLILRPHNVFGEGQALHDKHRNVVAIFMNRIMQGEHLFVYGDGEQTRAFSYIDDSLPCFVRAVEGVGVDIPARVVNVGGIAHATVNDLAQAVKAAMGVDADYPVVYHRDRPREVKHAYSTYELSQTALGYDERVGWREGVNRMAAWARERGPQSWVNREEMEIASGLLPVPWRE